MQLLFARLSPELRVFAIRKLGRFLMTTSLPSMIVEAAILTEAAAKSDASAVLQHIVEPLLAQIEAELPGLAHAPSGQLSKVPQSAFGRLMSRAAWPAEKWLRKTDEAPALCTLQCFVSQTISMSCILLTFVTSRYQLLYNAQRHL